jgi:hypothetical protein
MSIFDRLRRWLTPSTPTAELPAEQATAREIESRTKDTSHPPMKAVNSITFSADLSTLYLIDDGRAIAFPLESRGVQLALINDQIGVVTTAKEVEVPLPTPEMAPADADLALTKHGRASLLKRPEGKELRLKLDPRDQYTVIFNPDSGIMGIIGSTDIISTRPEPGEEEEPQAECRQFLFDLNREIVMVRKVGQILSIQSKDR